MGCGAGVISNVKISLDISKCPKVSVYNMWQWQRSCVTGMWNPDEFFPPVLHLCTGCGAGVILNIQTSLDISKCPKVSVYNWTRKMKFIPGHGTSAAGNPAMSFHMKCSCQGPMAPGPPVWKETL